MMDVDAIKGPRRQRMTAMQRRAYEVQQGLALEFTKAQVVKAICDTYLECVVRKEAAPGAAATHVADKLGLVAECKAELARRGK